MTVAPTAQKSQDHDIPKMMTFHNHDIKMWNISQEISFMYPKSRHPMTSKDIKTFCDKVQASDDLQRYKDIL